MPACDIHCCLLSRQLLPNLLPLLDPATRPAAVALLVSPDMERQSTLVSEICKRLGIAVECRNVAAYDFANVEEVVLELLEASEGRSLALNVTGGTKIMALGAFQACRELASEIFYIDTQNDRRVTLLPRTDNAPLPDVLRVRACLEAFGYQELQRGEQEVPREHRELTDSLLRDLNRLQRALPTLNYYAAAAHRGQAVSLHGEHLQWAEFQELVQRFSQAGCLDIDGQGRLVFPGEEQRQFVNGGWLEKHVLAVCRKLAHQRRITDLAANLQVASADAVENELDVAFTARNRLFLVECKTRLFARTPKEIDSGVREAAVNAINKLQALRQELAGVYGRALFVSAMRLSRADEQRCRKYGIELVQASDIANLPQRLGQSIENA